MGEKLNIANLYYQDSNGEYHKVNSEPINIEIYAPGTRQLIITEVVNDNE